MEKKRYTIGQLAELSGASPRAIRYYEDMGIIAPRRLANGYRSYSDADVRRLAQILSMRACGLPLPTIRKIIGNPEIELHDALCSHLLSLRKQRESLDEAMLRTKKAIAATERMESMDEKTAFEQIKAEELEKFEKRYGTETRERYGSEAIDATNERMMSLTQNEWEAKELLEDSIKVQLRIAMATGDPAGDDSHELARMHERWIRLHWGESYTREAHRSLACAYLDDSRFIDYYDGAAGKGATEFLVKALLGNLSTTV